MEAICRLEILKKNFFKTMFMGRTINRVSTYQISMMYQNFLILNITNVLQKVIFQIILKKK